MRSDYFNSHNIAPYIPPLALGQHAAFSMADVVFDWTSFEIPRGVACLQGASMAIRHNKISSQVAGIVLIFAKGDGNGNDPDSLQIVNKTAGGINFSRTDVMGYLPARTQFVPSDDSVKQVDISPIGGTAINWQTSTLNNGIVFEPNPTGGQNVGVDRYWVAGIANGALDLQGLVALDDDVTISGEDGTIDDLDGTAPSALFAPGDILMVNDGVMLGEVASLDTNSITFKYSGETSTNHARLAYLNHNSYTVGNTPPAVPANIAAWRSASGDLANNEIVYNVYPIRLTLHFSK